jgi:hypothetical protein
MNRPTIGEKETLCDCEDVIILGGCGFKCELPKGHGGDHVQGGCANDNDSRWFIRWHHGVNSRPKGRA